MGTNEQSIRIKVMSKVGCEIITLDPITEMRVLKKILADKAGIHENSVVISKGYFQPREVVDFSKPSATIVQCKITSGDIFYVSEKSQEEVRAGKCSESIMTNDIKLTDDSPGMLLKRVVPGDNSCLFTSVGFVLNGTVDSACAEYMRNIVANAIEEDPEEFSEAILGKPNADYCKWIKQPDSWGGAIELSILSKYYGVEIAVIDSVNAIINRFGEDLHYPIRVFLIFDGLHFDPLYLEREGHENQTIFLAEDNNVMQQAMRLAKEANSSRQFTDVQTFTLKCMDCGVMINGQHTASKHAKETGHTNFGEVMP